MRKNKHFPSQEEIDQKADSFISKEEYFKNVSVHLEELCNILSYSIAPIDLRLMIGGKVDTELLGDKYINNSINKLIKKASSMLIESYTKEEKEFYDRFPIINDSSHSRVLFGEKKREGTSISDMYDTSVQGSLFIGIKSTRSTISPVWTRLKHDASLTSPNDKSIYRNRGTDCNLENTVEKNSLKLAVALNNINPLAYVGKSIDLIYNR